MTDRSPRRSPSRIWGRRACVLSLAAALGACGASAPAPAPAPKRVIVSEGKVDILDPVTFTGEADLAPTSYPLLDSMVETIDGNPQLKLIEVQVSVAEGDLAARQPLGERRARVIVDYLIRKGVAAARLRASGAAGPKSEVAFLIVERG